MLALLEIYSVITVGNKIKPITVGNKIKPITVRNENKKEQLYEKTGTKEKP